MSRILDLLQVLSLPGGARIFLRRDYDKLGRLLQRLAGGYRRLACTSAGSRLRLNEQTGDRPIGTT
jgi:hypothetical protein